MNILIVAVGKIKTTHYESALRDYERRLSRWVKLSWRIVPTASPEKETEQLLRAIPEPSYVIVLDERGQQYSTAQMSRQIESLQNQAYKNLVFIIGGAYGVSDTLRDRADFVWSLSALTLPHELVRVILAEQLYRAYDILHGNNYHHA